MNNISKRLKGRLGNVMFQLAHHLSTIKENEHLKCIYTNEQLEFLMELKQTFNLDISIQYSLKKPGMIEYFQSENFFNKDLIKKIFKPKKDININIPIDFNNTVGIHVRRGDYLLHSSIWTVQSKEWYEYAANKFFSAAINGIQYSFLIASDDLNWCKENLNRLPGKIIFLDKPLSSVKTMLLMSKCKHHIGSASSFSWWISWLREQIDSINVFPLKWYNTNFKPNTILTQEQICCINQMNEIVPNRWFKF